MATVATPLANIVEAILPAMMLRLPRPVSTPTAVILDRACRYQPSDFALPGSIIGSWASRATIPRGRVARRRVARGPRVIVVFVVVIAAPTAVFPLMMRMMSVVHAACAVPRADAIVIVGMALSVDALRAVAGAVMSDVVASAGVRVGGGVVAATPAASSAPQS